MNLHAGIFQQHVNLNTFVWSNQRISNESPFHPNPILDQIMYWMCFSSCSHCTHESNLTRIERNEMERTTKRDDTTFRCYMWRRCNDISLTRTPHFIICSVCAVLYGAMLCCAVLCFAVAIHEQNIRILWCACSLLKGIGVVLWVDWMVGVCAIHFTFLLHVFYIFGSHVSSYVESRSFVESSHSRLLVGPRSLEFWSVISVEPMLLMWWSRCRHIVRCWCCLAKQRDREQSGAGEGRDENVSEKTFSNLLRKYYSCVHNTYIHTF